MINFFIKTFLSALAVLGCAFLIPGISVSGGYMTAFVVAIVLAVLNSLLRPVLVFFTFPITVLTLGLFLIVLNGFIVYIASSFVSGFQVDGMIPSIIFSLVYSVFGIVIDKIMDEKKK